MDAVDSLPLECDGMTRVISTILQRDGVEHCVHIGRVEVVGVGVIPFHWWIRLPDGQVCDLRARIWLGTDQRVPHGIFELQAHHQYQSYDEVPPGEICLAPAVFHVLTSQPLEAFQSS